MPNDIQEDSQSDFRLYYSNSLEILARLLAQQLRDCPPEQSLLTPDIVIIPQPAMRRWLQASLAAEHGIVANITFLTPGEFVSAVLDANLGPSSQDFNRQSLHWRVYTALTQRTCDAASALSTYDQILTDQDPLKPWVLAEELSKAFEKYQAWRRDWLLDWEQGGQPDDPQACLWRLLAKGQNHRARRMTQYLARLSSPSATPLRGLPSRLAVFATLNVSPDVMHIIASQSLTGTLHCYLPTPCAEYWGDLPRRHQVLSHSLATQTEGQVTDENALLHAWGAAGRDFMALLGSYELIHPRGEIHAYAEPIHASHQTRSDGGLSDSLLHCIQSDLLHRRPASCEFIRASLDQDDPSLQIHACHSRVSELYVLHDQLCGLLDDPRFDPPLTPSDIVVLAPDIHQYAHYIPAIFNQKKKEGGLPYLLIDINPLISNALIALFMQLLHLPLLRFTLNDVFDIISNPVLASAIDLDQKHLSILCQQFSDAGVFWGIDAAHREKLGATADATGTWSFAINRLLLGYALGEEVDIDAVATIPYYEGSALAFLNRFLSLFDILVEYQSCLSDSVPAEIWRHRLLQLLTKLWPEPQLDAQIQSGLTQLRHVIDDFAQHARHTQIQQSIPAEIVRYHFQQVLSQMPTRAPFLNGAITFGQMVPMRLIPFRILCLLGMNDGEFPHHDLTGGLNRLAQISTSPLRRLGDHSRCDDDRFLLLQLLCAAQDVFYISYVATHSADGSVCEPSLVVTELIDAAVEYHHQPSQVAQQFTIRHPQHAFSPKAFGTEDKRCFSYQSQWHATAKALQQGQSTVATATMPRVPSLETDSEYQLRDLHQFLHSPIQYFLSQRLQTRIPRKSVCYEETEPLVLARVGRRRQAIDTWLFERLTNLQVTEPTLDRLFVEAKARAFVPASILGRQQLQQRVDGISPLVAAFRQWRGTEFAQNDSGAIALTLGTLSGTVKMSYPHGIVQLALRERSGATILHQGLDWLFISALGATVPVVRFYDDPIHGYGPHVCPLLATQQALDILGQLMQLRAIGLQRPLLFGPYSGWKIYQRQRKQATIQSSQVSEDWFGTDQQWGDGRDIAMRFAVGHPDVLACDNATQILLAMTDFIFNAVVNGNTNPQILAQLEQSS